MAKDDHYIPSGTRVRLDWLDEHGQPAPECGVVIHCWREEVGGFYDCYVAFFGQDFPSGAPKEQPYILRYAAKSLTVLKETGD